MQKRIKKVLVSLLIIISILGIYFLAYSRLEFIRIKCLFHELTGLNCPGCGITRMILSFLQFDFYSGIKYNYFLGYTFIVIIFMVGYFIYSYIYNKKIKQIEYFNMFYLVLFILWGIIRNIFKL